MAFPTRAVLWIVRHLIAILILPFTVVVLIPHWIMTQPGAPVHGSGNLLSHLAGGAVFAAGFALFAWCISLFARVGKGTLAPWDPTQRLVAVGPYLHGRNPMISGVVTMLAGEALFHLSLSLAKWFLFFLALNHIYFLLLEEPGLDRRFGAQYRRYKANVPRWLPRIDAWKED